MKLFTSINISPRMLFGFDETWLTQLAKQFIRTGDVVYDIGAHIGYTALVFSKLVGEKGKVHAFELLPSVASNYLQKTLIANQIKNTKVHAIGIADTQTDIDIFVGNTMMGTLTKGGYESGIIEKCQIDTLDNYIKSNNIPPPNLIKIDVERAEIACLTGALETIKKFNPILIIEFHNKELLRLGYKVLTELGYRLQTKTDVVNEDYLSKITSFYGNILAQKIDK
ncbi:FkbM family methyltransferase [Nubsella zeaxanthinifaciens]|uniref:FkbM family methyltransferase n=1 Tax=Nubsella zeaxanthinifaciens TaxID=392412 RepID=UPI003D02449D